MSVSPRRADIGDEITVTARLKLLSGGSGYGGTTVSIPNFGKSGTGAKESSYDSTEGAVDTDSYTNGTSKVGYYLKGYSSMQKENGSTDTSDYLIVETEETDWPLDEYRTMVLKVIPKQAGNIQINGRGWICEDGWNDCVYDPTRGDRDEQQGWFVDEITVRVDDPNEEPDVDRDSPREGRITIKKGETRLFEAEVSDDDENLEECEWSVDRVSKRVDTVDSDSDEISFSYKFDDPGVHEMKVTCSDTPGNSDSVSWTVTVEDTTPVIETDAFVSRDEVFVGQEFTVTAKIRRTSGDSGNGGSTISFPGFVQSGTGAKESSYDSPEGTVTTKSYTNGASMVGYYLKGYPTMHKEDGTTGTTEYLIVETDDADWPVNKDRTLEVTITPKQAGELKINVRGWLCKDAYGECVYDPASGDTDQQQGWSVEILTVTVSNPGPEVDRISPSGSITLDPAEEQIFEASVSDEDMNLEECEWSVDGVSKEVDDADSGSATVEFPFASNNPAVYELEVTCSDTPGNSDSVSWTVTVEDTTPVIETDAFVSRDEVFVGQEFTVTAKIRRTSGDSGNGGSTISFPGFVQSGTGAKESSYDSPEGTVTTKSYTNGASMVGYYLKGYPTMHKEDGTTGTTEYLIVETDDADWPVNKDRTLEVTITPKQAGELKINVRGWLCKDAYGECVYDPASGDTDQQQGWSVEILTVTVSNPGPEVDRISPSGSITLDPAEEQIFEASVSDEDMNLEECEWSVDGVSKEVDDADSGSATVEFPFASNNPAVYELEVTCSDTPGNSDSVSWTVTVEDTTPVIETDAFVSRDEVFVGQEFTVTAKIRRTSGDSGNGGSTISFPGFVQSGTGAKESSYDSPEGTVTTKSYTNGASMVGYYLKGYPTMHKEDGTTGTTEYLIVETDDADWPVNKDRTLEVTITPKQAGELKINVRGWLCKDAYGECVYDPASGDTDQQQGWSVEILTVTVSDLPPGTILAIVSSNPPDRTVTVDGSEHIAPYTDAWNSGSSHALGAPTLQDVPGTSSRWAFSSWSHGGTREQTVSPAAQAIYTANFTLQHFLSTRGHPTGVGIPGGGTWYNHGSTATVGPAPKLAGYDFSYWRKDGETIGYNSGSVSVTVDAPLAVEAVYTKGQTVTDGTATVTGGTPSSGESSGGGGFTGSGATNSTKLEIEVDADVSSDLVVVNQSFTITARIRRTSGDPGYGGTTISIPGFVKSGTGDKESSYDSTEGSVSTESYTNGSDKVGYYLKGYSSMLKRDGSTGTTDYLIVETEDTDWPVNEYRTLKVTITPKHAGEFKVNVRGWLCEDAYQACIYEADGSDRDRQQGWPVKVLTVTVTEPAPETVPAGVSVPPVDEPLTVEAVYTRDQTISISEPVIEMDVEVSAPKLFLNQAFTLTAKLRLISGDSGYGGISISIPGFGQPDSDPGAASYESSQGRVVTKSYTNDISLVYQMRNGDYPIYKSDGTAGTAEYLLVESDDDDWPANEDRFLKIEVTPKQAGILRINIRGWICEDEYYGCVYYPSSGPKDPQQGWPVEVLEIEVENRQPQISDASPDVDVSLNDGDTQTFEARVSDPDGNLSSCQWAVDDVLQKLQHAVAPSKDIYFDYRFNATGTSEIKLTCTDTEGVASSWVWNVMVNPRVEREHISTRPFDTLGFAGGDLYIQSNQISRVYWDNNFLGIMSETIVGYGPPYEFKIEDVTEGTYRLRLTSYHYENLTSSVLSVPIKVSLYEYLEKINTIVLNHQLWNQDWPPAQPISPVNVTARKLKGQKAKIEWEYYGRDPVGFLIEWRDPNKVGWNVVERVSSESRGITVSEEAHYPATERACDLIFSHFDRTNLSDMSVQLTRPAKAKNCAGEYRVTTVNESGRSSSTPARAAATLILITEGASNEVRDAAEVLAEGLEKSLGLEVIVAKESQLNGESGDYDASLYHLIIIGSPGVESPLLHLVVDGINSIGLQAAFHSGGSMTLTEKGTECGAVSVEADGAIISIAHPYHPGMAALLILGEQVHIEQFVRDYGLIAGVWGFAKDTGWGVAALVQIVMTAQTDLYLAPGYYVFDLYSENDWRILYPGPLSRQEIDAFYDAIYTGVADLPSHYYAIYTDVADILSDDINRPPPIAITVYCWTTGPTTDTRLV